MASLETPTQGGGRSEAEKQAKKEAKAAAKAAKEAEKAARAAARQAQQSAASGPAEDDPLKDKFGDLPRIQSNPLSGKVWTKLGDLDASLAEKPVLVRGRVHTVRGKGKSAFLVLRSRMFTLQVVFWADDVNCSKGMIKYVTGIPRESVVDVEGVIKVPEQAISGATQQVELIATGVRAVSRAMATLPMQVEDAARSEKDFEADPSFVRVSQDTRLDNRVIDLRTPANQAIFRVQSGVCSLFRESLGGNGFTEIHTPKLIGGSSEGGANVFKLDYMGQSGCLAQSPQLYKQMCIMGDLERVMEIGPVFRAENSNTHRHLCEFTGLDMEMEIKEHFHEVLDVLDKLFLDIFDGLNERYATELATINAQYPFEPLKYLRGGLRLTFPEGIKMLHDAGYDVDPLEDLSTETERVLGQLVKEKYDTDFYMLTRYPLNARPFYTMPAPDDPNYTNSFDIFIRGEEIISGAQRIHEPELLIERAEACGIDVKTIEAYVDSFRFGAFPHGGCGVGLERVVMLFCDLKNIRRTSMYPRTPTRLHP